VDWGDFMAGIYTLWASLNDISGKQESHQRIFLIALKIYFVNFTNKN
jgi:hypothetical protein